MACFAPLTGYRSRYINPKTGKRAIVFSTSEGYIDQEVQVPCGRCTGCRLEHSRQWAVRCMHEADTHDANCFITLTYNPENLPADNSIHKEELQKFFKRLRKRLYPKTFRYFACGEYGEKNNRPHYHALIFGFNFPDRQLHAISNGGHRLYRSHLLETVWGKGHILIGELTFESAAYTARYVMKKRKGKPDTVDPKTGKTNEEHYMSVDADTGELYRLEPEFVLMSRRPGIGRDWYEKYKGDTKKDFITVRGNKSKIPKYYDSILEQENELELMEKKRKRKKEALKRKEDNTPERLNVKEKVLNAKLNQLIRPLED